MQEQLFEPKALAEETGITPETYFVYAWQPIGDNYCKIGKSQGKSFYNRIKTAQSSNWKDIKILGIEIVENEYESYMRERELIFNFNRLHSNREWVIYDSAVIDWLKTHCLTQNLSFKLFKELGEKSKPHLTEVELEQRRMNGRKTYRRNSQDPRYLQRQSERINRWRKQDKAKNPEKYREISEKRKSYHKEWHTKNKHRIDPYTGKVRPKDLDPNQITLEMNE